MSATTDTPERFSTIAFMLRLGASIVLPVLLIGAGLYYFVASDGVDRALDRRAETMAALLDAELTLAVNADGGVEIDRDATAAVVEGVLTDVFGAGLEVRVVTLDGDVLTSTDPTELGLSLAIDLVDASVLRSVASARIVDGTTTQVVYSIPLTVDGAVRAAARVDVPDDQVIGAAVDDASRLVYLFGGALLGIILLLVPLCWWSLGEVRRQFRKTRILALNDALTGLANRTQFRQRLDEAMAGASRSDARVGLVMVDLDGFKAINDNGGHAAGDRLLKQVAAALGEVTRRHEIPCRLGGDEFAVLAPRLEDRDELVKLADRLHSQLDFSVPFSDGRTLRVTASLGLALYPDDAASADDLVNHADRGMYSVKASRKAKLPAEAQERAASGRR